MVKRLYAIRDDKVGTFNPPCIVDNDAVAIRQFGDLVHDAKDTLITRHPDDFSIWYLAEYDDEKGLFASSVETLKVLARGSDFVKSEVK